jgi:hypothetical protein
MTMELEREGERGREQKKTEKPEKPLRKRSK